MSSSPDVARPRRSRISAAAALVVALALIATACSNSGNKEASSSTTKGSETSTGGPTTTADLKKFVKSDQPGVTDTTIEVGGVVSVTNPLGLDYAGIGDGVRAYFDKVNSEGGIYGRKLVLKTVRDDKLANNQTEIKGLLDQDNVFAAMPLATIAFFTGAQELTDRGVPGFGWNINPEFIGKDNLFGQDGALCWTEKCPGHFVPWLAKQAGATKVGIISFSVPSSQNCATAQRESFKKYGGDVVFFDASLTFGIASMASQVSEMKAKGVQFVSTCFDANTSLQLAKEMKKQGLDAVQFVPQGYDDAFVKANGEFYEGSYLSPQFVPFESRPKISAMKEYDKWVKKGGFKRSEPTMIGWIDADQFVTGLKLAGPEFTRQKVIDGLNTLKDYDAHGLLAGLDWTIQHKDSTNNPEFRPDTECTAVVSISKGKFVADVMPPGKPFVCFDRTDPTIDNPTFRD